MAKKAPQLASKLIGMAVMEALEDGYAEVIRHHQNRRVPDESVSVLTIDVSIECVNGSRRSQFTGTVKPKVKFAEPKRDVQKVTTFVRVDDDGDPCETYDSDPRQMRMNLDDRDRVPTPA